MKRFARVSIALALVLATFLAMTIPASATELKIGIGIVETSGLRLRAAASTDSDILANAAYGDNVVIIRESGDFYLVDYNLQIGYMAKQYITFKDRENIDLGYGEVEDASVNMRSTPSSDGDLVAQLGTGDKAYIIGLNCGWYKVQYNGQTGYVRSDLLSLTQAPSTNSAGGSTAPSVSVGQQIVNFAENYLGYPYVWGGTSPDTGFDCSGFVKYVFAQMGYSLSRTAAQQTTNGYSVTDLEVGDLVFFNGTYSSNTAASHVGIYIGDNQFIHAASGGIKITSLSEDYYAARYVGARRVI
jgi:cell wall-associated NlpC family hydrolase